MASKMNFKECPVLGIHDDNVDDNVDNDDVAAVPDADDGLVEPSSMSSTKSESSDKDRPPPK